METVHPLKAYRRTAQLTQKQLAGMLGVERETVGRWEIGHRKIDVRLVPAVSKTTGISRAVLRPDVFSEAAQ